MKILFMCVANSARSQLAEGIARQLFNPTADIRSAGSKPTKVNPFALQALQEIGADLSPLYSKSIDDLPAQFLEQLDYVITLCAEEVCPAIITKAKRLHWPLPDPAGQNGDDLEQISRFRETRTRIKLNLENFLTENCPP